jgi:hypothetical protein
MLPKDIADSPAALIALAEQNASDARLGQFKRGAQGNIYNLKVMIFSLGNAMQ